MKQERISNWNLLELISNIINVNSNQNELLTQLRETHSWEQLVKIASNHLLLPTLYYNLKRKQVIDKVPSDLQMYLSEISSINKARNLEILKEAKDISRVLNDNNIDYTFIKGLGLLIKGCFDPEFERMIGDIDLLVRPDQCEKAFELISHLGYNKRIDFNYQQTGFRHLPRQVNEDRLAAIEIHTTILNKNYEHIIDPSIILRDKIAVNGMNLPSDLHQLEIAIYTNQINNHAYFFNSINLKTTYDVLSIIDTSSKEIINNLKLDKYISKFLILSGLFFPALISNPLYQKNPFYRTFFVLSNNYPKIGSTMFASKSVFLAIKTRLKLFLFNKSYRKHVIANKL